VRGINLKCFLFLSSGGMGDWFNILAKIFILVSFERLDDVEGEIVQGKCPFW
jgi:hypothetical protein